MIDRAEVNRRFCVVRPDEIAECYNGVLAEGDLYEALWACVPKYKAPRPEISEEPCYGMDSVARFWDDFTPEQQAALIRVDDRRAAEEAAFEDAYEGNGR